MKVAYHYCAMTQFASGELEYMDGTIVTPLDPSDREGYRQIKQAIADNFRFPLSGDRMTLLSLSRLSAE